MDFSNNLNNAVLLVLTDMINNTNNSDNTTFVNYPYSYLGTTYINSSNSFGSNSFGNNNVNDDRRDGDAGDAGYGDAGYGDAGDGDAEDGDDDEDAEDAEDAEDGDADDGGSNTTNNSQRSYIGNLNGRYIPLNRRVMFRSNFLNYLNNFSDNVVNNFIDSTLNNSKPVYKKIASKNGLKQIEEVPYTENQYSQNMCPIYCTPFTDNETICKLPCNHVFSKDGIYTWLKESHLCPVCRFELDFVEVKDTTNVHSNMTASSEDNDTGTGSGSGVTNETGDTNDISNQFPYVNNYPAFNLVNILLEQQQMEQLEYQQAILRSLSEN